MRLLQTHRGHFRRKAITETGVGAKQFSGENLTCGKFSALPANLRGGTMQNGSLICRQRQQGPNAWEFRWREPGSDGKRRHRRIVLGSTLEFVDERAARQAI